MQVSAVERIRDGPIPGTVFGQIGIEQIHRDGMARHAGDVMTPGTNVHGPALDFDGDSRLHRFGEIVDRPGHRLLRLPPLLIEPLIKIAPPVEQRDADHRHAQIGCGTNRVAGQNPESSRIGRHQRIQADLHGKVRHEGLAVLPGHEASSTCLISRSSSRTSRGMRKCRRTCSRPARPNSPRSPGRCSRWSSRSAQASTLSTRFF